MTFFDLLTNVRFMVALVIVVYVLLKTDVIPKFLFRRRLASAFFSIAILQIFLLTYGARIDPSFSITGENVALLFVIGFVSAFLRELFDGILFID